MFVKDPPTLFEKLPTPPVARFEHRFLMFLMPFYNFKKKKIPLWANKLVEDQLVHFGGPI